MTDKKKDATTKESSKDDDWKPNRTVTHMESLSKYGENDEQKQKRKPKRK